VLARRLLRYLDEVRPVGRSSLLGTLGTARRYRWAEVPLQDVLEIRTAYGCKVNDVVLTAVTMAFQELLMRRGENLSADKLRTLIPVSVRRPDQRGHLDNRVSAILLDLPLDVTDPDAVLAVVAERMAELKASHEAEAGELLTSLGNSLPPPGLAAGLKLAFRLPQRVLTTVVTNVPGPREELHLAGRRMLAAYPYVPIADRLRTGIAVTSYGDNLLFGITADWESTPDVDVLRDALVAAFADLIKRSRER
jgi:diacylglycerol O-acyltransferase